MKEFNPMADDELHDLGPWIVSDDGRSIESDDFTHDVILRICGDFFSDEQRKAYAENLAIKLNSHIVQGANMIETIRRMSSHERKCVANVAVLVACAGVLLGWLLHMQTHEPEKTTWQDVVNVMPAKIKEDIAIDFCISHKRMCRNLPLSSPIQPADSTKQ